MARVAVVTGGTRGIGQHDEKLSAAGGAEQDARKSEFTQERAWQNFGEKRDPLRAPGE